MCQVGPAWRSSPSGLDTGPGTGRHHTGRRTDGPNYVSPNLSAELVISFSFLQFFSFSLSKWYNHIYISSVSQYIYSTHILARLPKFCSFLYFSTIRTSPQDKYLVSAGGAGWLRCSLMSVSRSIQSQVFSVHGALLTRNSSAYAGKHSHGSQNKLCQSRQTRRSEHIVHASDTRVITT